MASLTLHKHTSHLSALNDTESGLS